ncbi:Methylcytosine dioxygenase TET2 [Stylophora pistillata]|uniref:Methylcytosine dioxygenase TET n=1 Tax=Stylophora pistillata TaxID=50429 RepID=A0A2B4RDT4_STYPI|nr:Methylcytosine dioxygenase TET2 [Stylophora pistillata]
MESNVERPTTPGTKSEAGEKRSGDFEDVVPRKKRRRCGACEPCLRKKTTSNVGKREGAQLRTALNEEDDVGDKSRLVSCEVDEPDKRTGGEGGERQIINDSVQGECKPQKPESPGAIHAQENTEVTQLQNTEISAADELPKDHHENKTASGDVHSTRSTEPGAEKPLTNCKIAVSRSESDFEPPPCNCPVSGKDDSPYYTYLGAAPNVNVLRNLLEERFGVNGSALRIELIGYTGKEGKNHLGCPIARWVIRRSSDQEKILVIARKRTDHVCDSTLTVVNIVLWEGITQERADYLYKALNTMLPQHGVPTARRCGINETKSCACQGVNEETCGASFSFGCSWSMYFNGCKFTRSKTPRKFKLLDSSKEEELENVMQTLATDLSTVYEKYAPQAFQNQVKGEREGLECRIGNNERRPFSGVTCCMDFCAHSHKDSRNMDGGATLVCSLLKPEAISSDEEQLHVLPLYRLLDKDGAPVRPNYVMPGHFLEPPMGVSPGYTTVTGQENSPKASKAVNNHDPQLKEGRKEVFQDLKNNNKTSSGSYVPFDGHSIPHGHAQSMHGFPNSVIHHHASSNQMMNNCFNGHYPHPHGSPLFQFHPHLGNNYVLNHCRAPEVHWVDENRIPYLYRNPGHLNHFHNSSNNFDNYGNYGNDTKVPLIGGTWNCRMPFGKTFPMNNTPSNRGVEYAKPKTVIHHYNGTPSDAVRGPSQIKWVDDKEVPLMRASSSVSLDENANIKEIENRKSVERKDVISSEQARKPFIVGDNMGGVAIALTHGSLLIEVAKKELHATTPLKNPQRQNPTRISLVFYQHKHMNLAQHGLGEWEQKVARKKLEGEVASMEVDGTVKDASVDLKEEDRELGYLDMLAETALSRADIDPSVTNKHNSSPGRSLELASVNHTVLSQNGADSPSEGVIRGRNDLNASKFPQRIEADFHGAKDTAKEILSNLSTTKPEQYSQMRNGTEFAPERPRQGQMGVNSVNIPQSNKHQNKEISSNPRQQIWGPMLHVHQNSEGPKRSIFSSNASAHNTSRIEPNKVLPVRNAGANHREPSQGEGLKLFSPSNGIIPERIVNSDSRGLDVVAEPSSAKPPEERPNTGTNFSVSRLLGDDNNNKGEKSTTGSSSSYRISSILGDEKTTSSAQGESDPDMTRQVPSHVRSSEKDPDVLARHHSVSEPTFQSPNVPMSPRFPFLPPFAHSAGIREKLSAGPERSYLDLSVAANRLFGYSPYKFGVPFPTYPSFFMPPFHPLLTSGNGLSSNLALVNSQNYLSSFMDSTKRIGDMNGMALDPASLTTISTATRTGVSYPIDTLITVAPYTQTCVTGHYQNWL